MSRLSVAETAALACVEWGETRASELVPADPGAAGFRRIVVLGYAVDDANQRAAQYGCKPGDVARAVHRLLCGAVP